MVQKAMTFVEKLPTKSEQLELIAALRSVTSSHIHVEVERARVTRMLSKMQEDEGKINEASETLQEVQVETYGSLEKKEKADLILEQMRLCMRQRDFVRMGIIANKITKKVLDEEGLEPLKLRYLALMALLSHAKHDAMELGKGAFSVLETRGIKEDPLKWQPALASACVYAALSYWDNHTNDFVHRLLNDARLADSLPAQYALLKMLTTDEIIPWPLPEPHGSVIHSHEAFKLDPNRVGAPGGPGSELTPGAVGSVGGAQEDSAMSIESSSKTNGVNSVAGGILTNFGLKPAGALISKVVLKEDEGRSMWWDILTKRVVQHNIRVIAKSYSRCTFSRLAQILALDAPTTEAMVSELVSNGSIYAKIDRPAGIVVFARPRPATEVLSDWATDLNQILSLLDNTTHLISKEVTTHAAKVLSAS
jgi:26S proteasome regulatory subunit N5